LDEEGVCGNVDGDGQNRCCLWKVFFSCNRGLPGIWDQEKPGRKSKIVSTDTKSRAAVCATDKKGIKETVKKREETSSNRTE